MRNTGQILEQTIIHRRKTPSPKEEKVYTQEDIDLIDNQYKQKETRLQQFIKDPNPILSEYRRSLVQEEPQFTQESIIYDKATGKWKIIKNKLEN